MNVKLKTISIAVAFFTGGALSAQSDKNDSIKKETTIEEVVLTGSYGVKVPPERAAGATAKISGDALSKPSGVSIDNIIQGQAAGVMATASSGQPGANTITLIRGITSLSGSNNPLYVVDGVPIPSGDISGLLATQNALSLLNPADIESVEILKDGVATSIYGSRGANGVFVITTKSGRKGRSDLNFTSEIGGGNLAFDKSKTLNAQEHVKLYGMALFNAGSAASQQAGEALATSAFGWDGKTNTDWYDAATRNSPSYQRYNLTYSGGVGNLSVYSSLGYMQQEGLDRSSTFDRYNGMLKGVWKASDKLSMNFSINLSQTKTSGPTDGSSFSNPTFTSRLLSPTQNIYNPNGSYNLDLFYINPTFNPLAIQDNDKTYGEFSKILTTVGADYNIVKGLRFNSVFGYDKTVSEEYTFWNPDFGDGLNPGDTNGNGNLFKYYGNRITWNWYNFLHYDKKFGEKHEIAASLGVEATRREVYTDSVSMQGTEAGSRDPYLSSFLNPIDATNSISRSGLVGYIGRASYTYSKFLTLTGTFRRDGYSGFTDFFGNFYGVGAAFDFGQAKLLPSQFQSLKLRASYGENGNTTVGPYSKFPTYSSLGQYFNSNAGGLANPGYGGESGIFWEVSKKSNIGLDFVVKGNLGITGSFDVFRNNNSSQIISVPVPGSSGVSSLFKNQADSYSKGFEANVGLDLFRGSDFNWNTKFLYSYTESKITNLSGDPSPTVQDGLKGYFPGHNPTEFYTRLWAGVDASNGDPLWYTDESRTNVTNDSNQAKLSFTGKKAMPTHIASWINDFSYKGFKLNFMFTFQGDYAVWDRWAFVTDSDGAYANLNQNEAALYDSWTPTNINASRPKIVNGGNRNSSANSTRYLYNGDHVRLKTLELGYRFTKEKLNVDGLKGLYVYFRGVNLWTYAFDKSLYFDPESNSNAFGTTAANLGVYDQTQPNMRQFMMGFSVDF